VVPLIALLTVPGEACGPFFPDRILIESNDTFLGLPYSTFSYEARQVPVPYEPPVRAVPAEIGADESPASAMAAQTERVDLEELNRVLAAAQPDSERRRHIVAEYTKVRQALTAHARSLDSWRERRWMGDGQDLAPKLDAALTVPEGLAGEFSDYLRGAIAYWHGDPGAARAAWQGLLERPAEERPLRSTWAAYMLGRSYLDEDPGRAVEWFRRVGELAGQGFSDPLGLAAASLGRMARVELDLGHYATALELYRVLLAAGDPSASVSMRLAARHAVAEAGPEARAACLANPTARRLITAYLVCASMLAGDARITTWLASFKSLETAVEESERLAWASYQAGNLALARGWLERAPADTPIAMWLRAKLLLRDGKTDQALPLIAAVAAHFPPDPEIRIERDNLYVPALFEARRANAEIGGIRLGRGEYASALEALVQGVDLEGERHWPDAAYVAEQVLTLAELKEFVDRRWPSPPPRTDPEARMGVEEKMRYLLARRLARQGRFDEAAPYFPDPVQGPFRNYVAELKKGKDPKQGAAARSEALWHAARLTRHQGMELIGTETDPDWVIVEGSYDLGMTRADRPKTGVNRASKDEIARSNRHRPKPDRRFHYRYLAADLGWEAARLMPDQSEQTARVLVIAGTWLKNIAPKEADRFYKALVSRCGSTELGREAIRRRWFPDLDGESRDSSGS
jgi:tetratricopeptide (TPR) repeat protein